MEYVRDWNDAATLDATRSLSGVLLFLDPLSALVRSGPAVWPPPEIAQKLSKAEISERYPVALRTSLERALGYYCALQSVHSEDALTWSVFGPVVYAEQDVRERFVAELLAVAGFHASSAAGATVWLWRRLPHPDTGVSGGPEIDVGIQTVDTLLLLEAKWLSREGRGQGKEGDRTQGELRRMLCEHDGLRRAYTTTRHFGVIGLTLNGAVLTAATAASTRPDVRLTDLDWADVCALESHPLRDEVIRYFVWKREHSRLPRQASSAPPPAALERTPIVGDGGLFVRTMQAVDGFRAKFGAWPTTLEIDAEWWQTLRDSHLGPRGATNLSARLRVVHAGDALRVSDDAGRSYDYQTDAWLWQHRGTPAREWCALGAADDA